MKLTEKELNEILTVITEYNGKISENSFDTYQLISYSTTGDIHVISYGNEVLWSSEGFGERRYNETTDKYEPFRSLIKRELNNLIERHKKVNKLINRK